MTIQLTKDEYEALLPLVERRISEFYTEIRRAMTSLFRDDLKKQKRILVAIREMLISASGNEVELTSEQASTLRECIEECLRNIPGEIRHTHTTTWRQSLKSEKALFQNILNKLESEERALA
jgi:NifB/MoaA-like Fe-S oxidoreductase